MRKSAAGERRRHILPESFDKWRPETTQDWRQRMAEVCTKIENQIPKILVPDLLKTHRDKLYAGWQGMKRTKNFTKLQHIWPELNSYVEKYVRKVSHVQNLEVGEYICHHWENYRKHYHQLRWRQSVPFTTNSNNTTSRRDSGQGAAEEGNHAPRMSASTYVWQGEELHVRLNLMHVSLITSLAA
jgi:hypothetical protein